MKQVIFLTREDLKPQYNQIPICDITLGLIKGHPAYKSFLGWTQSQLSDLIVLIDNDQVKILKSRWSGCDILQLVDFYQVLNELMMRNGIETTEDN